MLEGKSGRKALKKMWSRQKGCCTLCGDEINKASGWKLHIPMEAKRKWYTPNATAGFIQNC